MGLLDSLSSALGTDGGNKGLLQGSLQGTSDAISGLGREVAKSPLAQAAITAGGAAFGVPPMLTASLLGINRTAQDGNIGAGLMTGLSSYAGGKAVNSYFGAEQIGGLAKYGLTTGLAASAGGAGGASQATNGIGSSYTGGGMSGYAMPSVYSAGLGGGGVYARSNDAQTLRERISGDLSVLDGKRTQLGSQAYRDGRVASVMGDVQGNFDRSQDQTNRTMMRMGVNPNSVRFASLTAQNGLGLATAKAGAANNERAAMDKELLGYLTSGADMARSGLQTAAGMDTDVGRLAITQDQINKQHELGLFGANTANYNAETARLTGNSAIASQQNKDDPLRTLLGTGIGAYASNSDFRDFVNGGLSSGWDYVSKLFN